MSRRVISVFVAVSVTAVMVAQRPQLTVKVEKKPNAQAQLDFARSLASKLAATTTSAEKHAVVAEAAANFMAVERGWPNQRLAVIEANALLAELYVAGEMPLNAVAAAERGLAAAPDDHRLYVAAARAHARLGDRAAATAAFSKAVETFDARRADLMTNLAAMTDAAAHFEGEKQHGRAAAALRHAATLQGLTPFVQLTLRVRALEQSALGSDGAATRQDLADLRDAHRTALGHTQTAAHRQLLDVAEKAIARFANQK